MSTGGLFGFFWFGGCAFFVLFVAADLGFYRSASIAVGVGVVFYFLLKAVIEKDEPM